jgi:hypothetical protein
MELYELPAEPSSIVWDGDVALLVVEAEALEEGGPIEKWTDRYLKPGIDRTKILAQAFGPFQGTEFPVWSIASSEKILGDRLDALTRQHLKEIRQEPAAY